MTISNNNTNHVDPPFSGVCPHEILEGLREIAFADYADTQIKASERIRALELLGKYQNLWAGNDVQTAQTLALLDNLLARLDEPDDAASPPKNGG
jgi:hypothetical protein